MNFKNWILALALINVSAVALAQRPVNDGCRPVVEGTRPVNEG